MTESLRAGRVKEFSLLYITETDSEAHTMGTGGCFPGIKWQGLEIDHSPATSADVKKTRIYKCTSAPT
jgi:hypothetical protein